MEAPVHVFLNRLSPGDPENTQEAMLDVYVWVQREGLGWGCELVGECSVVQKW